MGRNFLSINANYNDFCTLHSPKINKFVLENNNLLLKKVYGFLQKNDSLLIVSGFMGTGKKQICNHLLSYIDKNVYSFKIHCSQSMCLDDILLLLWSQFINVASNYELAKRLSFTSSFQERLSGCLINSPSNIILTFYDFDLIDEKNKQAILGFIWTLTNNEKIKIIISTKTFDTTLIPKETTYSKIIIKAFSKPIFDSFMKEHNIQSTPHLIDELYKITRGYFFYTDLTINILKKKNLNINNYLIAYTTSGLSFDKFLAKAYITMLPGEYRQLLHLMAIIRHPVNSQLLDYFELFNKSSLDYLTENKVLKITGDLIILNNYYREMLLEDMDNELISSLKTLLVKFYNSQLPLKPSERLIEISRTTLRNEIAYHLGQDIVENINDTQNVEPNKIDVNDMSDNEIKAKAEICTTEFKYTEAIKYYLKLIERGKGNNEINVNLAKIYSKVGNWKYALHYYNLAISQYENDQNLTGIYETKLEIAKIYYQSYKNNEAIKILNDIIENSNDNQSKIDAYTNIGNIYISLAEKNKAYDFYHKAILLQEDNKFDNQSSELYFKFAILSDENDDTNNALKYYQKCIDCATDINKYKALAYSNLGDFYLDNNDTNIALENFKLAYHFDKLNSNYYGVYYSATNIAKILIEQKSTECLQYLKASQNAAYKSNDIFAIANSSLHLGDYYSNNKQYIDALKEYFSVLDLVKDKFHQDNKNKILVRIDDIKHQMGENKFNEFCSNRN